MKNSKAGLIIAGILLVIIGNAKAIDVEIRLWAFLHLFLHALVFWLNLNKIKYQYSPFVLVISIFNFLTYGVSSLFVDKNDFQLGTLNPIALEVSFYAFAVFYVVLYIVEKIKLSRLSIDTGYSTDYNAHSYEDAVKFNRIKAILIFLYVIFWFAPAPVNELKTVVVYYTCGLLLIGFYLNTNNVFTNIILLLLIIVESFKAVSTSLLSPLIQLYLFLFIVSLKTFRKSTFNVFLSSLFIGIITSFIFIFTEIKVEYRTLSLGMSQVERFKIMGNLILNRSTASNYVEEPARLGLLWRVSYPLSGLSCVLEETPKNVPFWNGVSYYPLFTKLIPRFLWPDKPEENMGQTFGHAYKILADDNLTTSMNAPVLAEAYMNFSYLGIFVVIVLLAFIVGVLFFKDNLVFAETNQFFSVARFMKIMKIGYVTTLFVQWESNLSMILGKLLIVYIIDLVLRKLLLGKTGQSVLKKAYS